MNRKGIWSVVWCFAGTALMFVILVATLTLYIELTKRNTMFAAVVAAALFMGLWYWDATKREEE